MKALVVTEPFASYAKGEQITAPDKIEAALASNPHFVVGVEIADPAPQPQPQPQPAKASKADTAE